MANLHPTFDSTMNKSAVTRRFNKLSRQLMRVYTSGPSANLEEDISQWNIYHDQGFTDGALTSVSDPSMNGNALQVALSNGQPYAGVHAYRNMAPADDATSFDMYTSFYFADKASMQALEFTMNKWVNGQRYEWALQWQVVQDGSPEQGQAQSWRLWNGSQWLNTGVQQTLAPNAWHTLHLQGTIQNGQIYYTSFNCDSVETDLTTYSFLPVLSEGDKLAIGVQLDGNAFETPYNLAIENVHLNWN